MIKLRRIRWEWHVARMVERRDAYVVLVRRPKGKSHLEDIGINGRIILN